MRISIIGSNGYFGKNFVRFLSEKENELYLYDIQSVQSNHTQIDTTNKKDVEKINFDVDYVFVFSGLTGTNAGFSAYEDFIRVNELGLLNILDRVKDLNRKPHIIFPSTRLVYKGVTNSALDEDSGKDFKTIYAINKYACEKYLEMYQNCFGVPYTVFRVCVPFGNLVDDSFSYGTVGFFLNKAMNGEDITLFGDGDQKRTFTHIYDVIVQIMEALKYEEAINEIFNIGGETYSLSSLAIKIADKYNVQVQYNPWPEIHEKIESGDTIFSDRKINALINHTINYKIEDWITDL